MTLCSAPAGSSHGTPKQVHARDGVGGVTAHVAGGEASLAHVTFTCGHLDHVMVAYYQLHHMTSGWGCCHLNDRLMLGTAWMPILVSGMVSGIRA